MDVAERRGECDDRCVEREARVWERMRVCEWREDLRGEGGLARRDWEQNLERARERMGGWRCVGCVCDGGRVSFTMEAVGRN